MGGSAKNKATYQTWQDMKQRCFNEKCHNFPNYGGRGITVCERWLSFTNFFSDMGLRPEGLTLERINNNGNYEPSNCRWATRKEQRINQRTCVYLEYKGSRMTVEDWGRNIGVHPETLRSRIRRGYPIHMVLTTKKLLTGNKSPVLSAIQEQKK